MIRSLLNLMIISLPPAILGCGTPSQGNLRQPMTTGSDLGTPTTLDSNSRLPGEYFRAYDEGYSRTMQGFPLPVSGHVGEPLYPREDPRMKGLLDGARAASMDCFTKVRQEKAW